MCGKEYFIEGGEYIVSGLEEGEGIFFVEVEGGKYIVLGLEEEQGRFFIKVIAKQTRKTQQQTTYKHHTSYEIFTSSIFLNFYS